MLIGCSLYNKKVVLNLWYFEHALMLLPFLFVGVLLREHKPREHEDVAFLLLGVAFLCVAIIMKYYKIGLAYPYIIGVPGMFWGNFWLCILMGVSGSLALICDMSENWQMQMVGISRKTYLDYLSVTGVHNGFID